MYKNSERHKNQSEIGMKLRLTINALLVSSSLVYAGVSEVANAGAWVPAEGAGYAKVGLQNYTADDLFDENADFKEFSGQNISFYGEYGFGNKIAIYGSLLYQDIEQKNAQNETLNSAGIGDAEVGVRYQWVDSSYVLSTSLLVKLPYFYDENDDLPRGNGQEDYELRALFGKSLYPYGYFGAEFGYRLRAGAPSDEYRYILEYGFSANENLYFRTKLDGVASANNADSVDIGMSNLSLGPQFDLGKLELTAGWNLGQPAKDDQGRWGMEATYTKELYGEGTLKGEGIQLAITRVF
ncbi:MAG: hypothetical protein ACI9Y1_003172 [Lentisphaeria bacterium]|jgi:hypothetical protein